MKAFKNLQYRVEEGIATIMVDRPSKANALNRETIEELGRAIRSAEDDRAVRGVLMTGSGSKAFVAGADIGELENLGPAEATDISRAGQTVFRSIELATKPFLAAVNGFALGGGCELALACHLRLAVPAAAFGFPEVKLGIIPGYGGTVRLRRLVGVGRALELILTGEPILAGEAYRIGLVNRLTEPGQLLEEGHEMLRTIAENAPTAVSYALESVTRGLDLNSDDGLTLESTLFGRLAGTDDMREGMRAFLEKRKPRFTAR